MTDNDDPQDCTAKLKALLDDAQNAAGQEDDDLRRRVSEQLKQFMIDSTPNNARIVALDDIAVEAAKALLIRNIDDRLVSIRTINIDLAKTTKQFSAAAAHASATANGLRLERLKQTIETLNDGVASIRQLKDALNTGTDPQLLDSLTKAEAAVVSAREGLRTQAT